MPHISVIVSKKQKTRATESVGVYKEKEQVYFQGIDLNLNAWIS